MLSMKRALDLHPHILKTTYSYYYDTHSPIKNCFLRLICRQPTKMSSEMNDGENLVSAHQDNDDDDEGGGADEEEEEEEEEADWDNQQTITNTTALSDILKVSPSSANAIEQTAQGGSQVVDIDASTSLREAKDHNNSADNAVTVASVAAAGAAGEGDDDTVTCEEEEEEGSEKEEEEEARRRLLIGNEPDIAILAEQQQVFSGNSKQDYRLDFTEVEGTLEAVPEEGTAAAVAAAAKISAPAAPVTQEDSAATTGLPDVPTAASSFYCSAVPESNASDVAFSEYSFQAESVGTSQYSTSWYIRSSEPLTARQQVALWLTRTSISDMSSMPSLRSLVFPKSSSSSAGRRGGDHSSVSGRSSHHHHHHHNSSHGGKSQRSKSEIKRNFSTKSLISHGVMGKRGDDSGMLPSSPPMRKCSTMMSLPGEGGSNLSAPGVSKPIAIPSANRSRKSSFNLFRRLANSRRDDPSSMAGKSGKNVPGIAFSFTSAGSGCESPLRMVLTT